MCEAYISTRNRQRAGPGADTTVHGCEHMYLE